MPYATRDDVTIYYESKGNGIPIVFIHPPAMGMVTFQKQEPLAAVCNTIKFDIRGHGQSGFVKNQKLTMNMVSHDMKAILDELEIEKAVLCSYSSGGSNALDFALTFPERTSGIILCGGFSEVNSFLLSRQFKLGILTAKNEAIGLLAKVLSYSHTYLNEKQFRKQLAAYISKTNPNILYDLYSEGLIYNCSDQIGDIDVPILLVYGSRDFYIHHYQHIFLQKHGNADVIYVDKARHEVPTKFSKEFNQIIREFLLNKIKRS